MNAPRDCGTPLVGGESGLSPCLVTPIKRQPPRRTEISAVAVIVGVDAYHDQPLTSAVQDALDLADALCAGPGRTGVDNTSPPASTARRAAGDPRRGDG